jgi:hypothetical protein
MLPNRASRLAADLGQKLREAREEMLRRGPVEDVGGVGEGGGQRAVGMLRRVEAEVDLGCRHRQGERLDLEVAQPGEARELVLLVVEHHLEERVVAEAALGLERFHQLLERQLLMRLGRDGEPAHGRQQLVEAHRPGDAGAQHLRVDEEADQLLAFRPCPVGDRNADADILLPGDPVQPRHEGGQQQHERRGAVGRSQRAQAPCMVGGETVGDGPSTAIADSRAWPVGGQLQHRMLGAQNAPPELELPPAFTGLVPVALPEGIVRILDRPLRLLRLDTGGKGGVEPGQLVDQHPQRPAVRDDVVHPEEEDVLARPQPMELHAQKRPVHKVERLGRRLRQHRIQILGHRGDRHQRHRPRRLDVLPDLAVCGPEDRAQRLVQCCKRLEAAFQRCPVERAGQPQGTGQIVGGARGIELPEKP